MKRLQAISWPKLWVSTIVVVLALGAMTDIAWSAPAPDSPLPIDQIIIQYKPSARITAADARQPARLQALSQAAGTKLAYLREMSGNAHVLKLPARMPEADVRVIAARLQAMPDVKYAEPDRILQPDRVPNDPQYANQWGYSATWGIHAEEAWDIATGSGNFVIAVIDTGILPAHPDIAGYTVTGYDFISDEWRANDGDGRDSDPTDPGDWEAAGECGAGEPATDSSWHGTHVAGTIGAASDNGTGVAGVNWNSRILPVRVLGKCGGDTSDIADGIRWAAGLSVSGTPANANPARILNLSLGGEDTCGETLQSAIDDARNQNTIVIVSAGNENRNASDFVLANCNGVVAVAATDSAGQKASFSNYGTVVDLAAPGVGILSTGNSGTTAATTYTYTYMDGTSMSAPHVSGVASLALSVRPGLTPDQLEQLLWDSVTDFPSGSSCTTPLCGTGIVNAELAVREIYVNKDAADVQLGTPHEPFKTVNQANVVAWDGAWIKITAGSYDEAVTFSKRLRLVSSGGTVTIGQ